ncbi:PREDICTED: uncharacterized protein LOC104990307 [Bison bison bison]|uniref:Uncharacterized protein LOC104990307 n=1 Tax=Bison bison bison TaxID=43346 RepID=A0A6P3HEJ4_BISBB|nr:PREDICTED: uncharacterized protein LOC104990307 [Bison bison bison]
MAPNGPSVGGLAVPQSSSSRPTARAHGAPSPGVLGPHASEPQLAPPARALAAPPGPRPGPPAPLHHTPGTPAECLTSSSGLPCSWWWTLADPRSTWTTSSSWRGLHWHRVHRHRAQLRQAGGRQRRWTCASSSGGSCSSTRWACRPVPTGLPCPPAPPRAPHLPPAPLPLGLP